MDISKKILARSKMYCCLEYLKEIGGSNPESTLYILTFESYALPDEVRTW